VLRRASSVLFFVGVTALAACGSSLGERKPLAQTEIRHDDAKPEEKKPATPCELVEQRALSCPAEQALARSSEECEQRVVCLGKVSKVQGFLECAKTNTSDCAKACDVTTIASKDTLVQCGVLEPTSKVEPGQKPAKALVGTSNCPGPQARGSMSRLATKNCKKDSNRERSKVVAEIRTVEKGLAAGVNEKQRAQLTSRLASDYAELERILAFECLKGHPEALDGEIPFSEAKQQTDAHCATLKSQFTGWGKACP
jgi:hypothetical protein